MVENKNFIYDDDEASPPLVPAASAPLEETITDVDPLSSHDSNMVTVDGVEDGGTTLTTEEYEQSLMVGAGVGAGVIGCLLGGPIFACLTGFGAAHFAKKEGAAGDCARAIGQVALMARQKAVEVNQKHNLVRKGQDAANNAWEKAKEVDRRHNILERAKTFVVYSWNSLKEANRKHHLLQRATDGVGKAITFVTTKISEKLFNEQGHRDLYSPSAAEYYEETIIVREPSGATPKGYNAVAH